MMTNEQSNSENIQQSATEFTNNSVNSEKLVPQSLVNKIAHERHLAGYEKGKAEASSSSVQSSATISVDQLEQFYQEKRKQEKIAEEKEMKELLEAQDRYRLQKAEERVAAEAEIMTKKIMESSNKYDDFQESIKSVKINDPGLLLSLREIDNPADVVYALSKDVLLKNSLMNLLQSNNEETINEGIAYIKKYAETVKNNQASKDKLAPAPLSHIKPSSTAVDMRKATIADLRKKFTT